LPPADDHIPFAGGSGRIAREAGAAAGFQANVVAAGQDDLAVHLRDFGRLGVEHVALHEHGDSVVLGNRDHDGRARLRALPLIRRAVADFLFLSVVFPVWTRAASSGRVPP
jgi:hypothetical protein